MSSKSLTYGGNIRYTKYGFFKKAPRIISQIQCQDWMSSRNKTLVNFYIEYLKLPSSLFWLDTESEIEFQKDKTHLRKKYHMKNNFTAC